MSVGKGFIVDATNKLLARIAAARTAIDTSKVTPENYDSIKEDREGILADMVDTQAQAESILAQAEVVSIDTALEDTKKTIPSINTQLAAATANVDTATTAANRAKDAYDAANKGGIIPPPGIKSANGAINRIVSNNTATTEELRKATEIKNKLEAQLKDQSKKQTTALANKNAAIIKQTVAIIKAAAAKELNKQKKTQLQEVKQIRETAANREAQYKKDIEKAECDALLAKVNAILDAPLNADETKFLGEWQKALDISSIPGILGMKDEDIRKSPIGEKNPIIVALLATRKLATLKNTPAKDEFKKKLSCNTVQATYDSLQQDITDKNNGLYTALGIIADLAVKKAKEEAAKGLTGTPAVLKAKEESAAAWIERAVAKWKATKATKENADFLHRYTVDQVKSRLKELDENLAKQLQDQAKAGGEEDTATTKLLDDGFAALLKEETERNDAEQAAAKAAAEAVVQAKRQADATADAAAATKRASTATTKAGNAKAAQEAAAKAAQEAADAAKAAAATSTTPGTPEEEAAKADTLAKANLAAATTAAELEVATLNAARLAAEAAAASAAATAAATAAAPASAAAAPPASAAATAASATAAAAAAAAAPERNPRYLVTIRIPKNDFATFLKTSVSPATITWASADKKSVLVRNKQGTFVIKEGDCITATLLDILSVGKKDTITAKITHFVNKDAPVPYPQLYYSRYSNTKGAFGESKTFLDKNTYDSITLLAECPVVHTSLIP